MNSDYRNRGCGALNPSTLLPIMRNINRKRCKYILVDRRMVSVSSWHS